MPVSEGRKRGRPNQRFRTRKDLLLAAARLIKRGQKPTLEEVAEEAMVSRATTYRYFPNIDALLAESALDMETPEPDALFGDSASQDPVARLEAVDDALDAMILANESALRLMLARSLQREMIPGAMALPARQNRRTALIEAALEPLRKEIRPAAMKNLCRALAVMIGTEAFIVFRDVLQLDDVAARNTRRWAMRALLDAARKAE